MEQNIVTINCVASCHTNVVVCWYYCELLSRSKIYVLSNTSLFISTKTLRNNYYYFLTDIIWLRRMFDDVRKKQFDARI